MKNFLLVVLLLSLPSPVRADSPLVDFALNGFLETFEKIRTFHFQYQVTASDDRGLADVIKGEWWQEGENLRLNESSTGNGQTKEFSFAFLDGWGTFLSNGPNPWNENKPNTTTFGVQEFADANLVSVWGQLGLRINDRPVVKLVEALKSKEWAFTAKEEGSHIVISATSSRLSTGFPSYQFWFDTKNSFWPVRHVSFLYAGSFDPDKGHEELEVTSFTRVGKEKISFPKETRRRFFKDGKPGRKPWVDNSFVLKELIVNEPIPKELFRLSPAPGSAVQDLQKGVYYKVGPDGLPRATLPLLRLPVEAKAQTGGSTWFWLLAGLLGVFLGFIGIKYRRQLWTVLNRRL